MTESNREPADAAIEYDASSDEADAHFMSGMNAAIADEEQGTRTECPWINVAFARHWWTRGYAHQARAFRAIELRTRITELAQTHNELAFRRCNAALGLARERVTELEAQSERRRQLLEKSDERVSRLSARVTELEAQLAEANAQTQSALNQFHRCRQREDKWQARAENKGGKQCLKNVSRSAMLAISRSKFNAIPTNALRLSGRKKRSGLKIRA